MKKPYNMTDKTFGRIMTILVTIFIFVFVYRCADNQDRRAMKKIELLQDSIKVKHKELDIYMKQHCK